VPADTATTPYDVIAYPSRARRECDPAHLATIAALCGVETADVDRCRVLELGCGAGKGLISYALAHPRSRFVGVDLAETAVASGNRLIAELGLENVRLLHGDLAKFESSEPFDYVIAHGVYSWVPPETKSELLRVCRSVLGPHGIAYLGYATYPGCHLRELVRDLLLFHTDRVPDPKAKVHEGVEFLRFLSRVQTAGGAYGGVLQRELDRLSEADPNYVLHDDFAENNTPVYFAQLVQHAAEHGLKFLAEGLFAFFEDPTLSAEAKALLNQIAGNDSVTLEQYLDFVRCRSFRQTLLCRNDLGIDIGYRPSRVRSLFAGSALKPQNDEPDLTSRSVEIFRSPAGTELSADRPLVKAALTLLGRAWPRFIALDELLERAQALSGTASHDSSDGRALLVRTLVTAASGRLVELSVRPPQFATVLSERPCASPLARLEARDGPSVTCLRHFSVVLRDPASRHLLGLLDGQRSRADLLAAMRAFFEVQQAPPTDSGAPRPSPEELEHVLSQMAEHAFLIA
jgi:SAM-dependent methyltransferase